MTNGAEISITMGQLWGIIASLFAIGGVIVGYLSFSFGRKQHGRAETIQEGKNMAEFESIKKDIRFLEDEQQKIKNDLQKHDVTLAKIMTKLETIIEGQQRLEKKVDEMQSRYSGICEE